MAGRTNSSEGRLRGEAGACCNIENLHTRCNVGRAQQERHEVFCDVCKGAIILHRRFLIEEQFPRHLSVQCSVGEIEFG